MPSAQAKAIVDAIIDNDNVLTHDEIQNALNDMRDAAFNELKVDVAQAMFDDEQEYDESDDDFDYSDSDVEYEETDDDQF